ncbi:MAG: hypothetical protein HYZ53_11260 [Planctomycetes bacterium]|nr:hypothetical protein [Planctomycetota bacterium]
MAVPAPYHRLLVFVPEGDRTSKSLPVDLQDRWVIKLLNLFAELFGGATAYGRGVGVWRDPAARTYWDRVTVIESWVDPALLNRSRRMNRLGRTLSRMCAALNQRVVGCILDGKWIPYSRRRKP